MDDWPLVMITQSPSAKIECLIRDPHRYMQQCRRERLVEARDEVRRRMTLEAAVRRGRWLLRARQVIGAPDPADNSSRPASDPPVVAESVTTRARRNRLPPR